MSTKPIDFSDLGAVQVTPAQSGNSLDFSDLGAKRIGQSRQTEQPGMLSRAWDWANKGLISGKDIVNGAAQLKASNQPTTPVDPGAVTAGEVPQQPQTDYYQQLKDYINSPTKMSDLDHPTSTAIKKGLAGTATDTADALSSLTSPMSIALTGAGAAAKALPAASKVSKAAKVALGAAGATYGAQGAGNVGSAIDNKNAPLPDRLQQGLQGAAMMSGGAAGAIEGAPAAADVIGNAAKTAPIAAVRNAASDALDTSAQADLGKVLAPTKQATKYISKEKVIPGIQERGIVSRSSSALQDQAQSKMADLGQQIDDAYDAQPVQPSIPTKPIIDKLESYKKGFTNDVPALGGQPAKSVVMDQGAIDRIQAIQDKIAEHGDALDPQSMRNLRQYFDTNVAAGKGYAGKTMAEGHSLEIQKQAANAIRGQLADAIPGSADLNSEFSFWKNLNDVLEETAQRRTGQQGGGLGRKIATSTGAGVGAMVGGPKGAILGAEAGNQLSRLTNSTAWNTLKAAVKTKLANALSTGDAGALDSAMQEAERNAKAPAFIRGQLSAAPIITPPPPDASGSVPYTPPAVAATSRAQRLGLLLPESTDTPVELPASTAPTSREGVLPAAKQVVRDPKSGQMKVQYLTSPADPGAPVPVNTGKPSFLRNNGAAVADERMPSNSGQRKLVADMSPDERAQALLTSEKTGLPNYRAFQESSPDSGQHVGYADLDNFKQYNDALGHTGVDQAVLPAIGDMFKDVAQKHGVNVFHRSGDEFLFRSGDPQAISDAVNEMNQRLANTTFEYKTPDGKILTKKGTGLSHGVGEDEQSAELSAQQDKTARASQGLRTERENVQGLDPRSAGGQPSAAGDNPGREAIPPTPDDLGQDSLKPSFLRRPKKGGK